MITNSRRLPIGIQSFKKLRDERCVYVDKTAYIYRLVHDVTPFFLSRPRRFGKSLLLSTMRAYWEGKRDLFQGLAIEELEALHPDAWKPHPVFYFDFNGANYHEPDALEKVIDQHLKRWERSYGINPEPSDTLSARFQNLLQKACADSHLRSAILVDEYDKPLLDLLDAPMQQEHNKAVFKGFFSSLKSCDEFIQFVFITGVTKFHKVSIFSDLNQLNDISMSEEYSGLCGITEDELINTFSAEIAGMAEKNKLSDEDCLLRLKKQYDGYHFHPDGMGVYNPYSLLNAFYNNSYKAYWFETGTPTFLVKMLRSSHFDVRRFSDQTIYASESELLDYSGDTVSPTPLLYQSGYLTIADYNNRLGRYTLCFPNEEVKYGFLNSMIPEYIPTANAANGLDIFTLEDYIENGRLEDIRKVLTGLFARISYTSQDAAFEHYFQTVIYLVFTLLGKYALCEMHTFNGRIDCKVETDNYVYLFEFKRDKTAEEALRQIEDKSYTLPFTADSRKVFKIGVSFDSEKRLLSDWKAVEM